MSASRVCSPACAKAGSKEVPVRGRIKDEVACHVHSPHTVQLRTQRLSQAA